jgi:hypothetical protein
MNIDAAELDLEFLEQDAEEHLTQHEALLLGLEVDTDVRAYGADGADWMRM